MNLKLKRQMMFKHKWGSLLPLFSILSCMLVSCTENIVLHSYTHVPSQWGLADTLSISLPDSLPAGRYSVQVETRNTSRYPYRDLWLLMCTVYEKDAEVFSSADTLHLRLTDDRGEWKSPNTIGAYYQAEHRLAHPLFVEQNAYHYQYRFQHIMSDSLLCGLSDIGVCIHKQ